MTNLPFILKYLGDSNGKALLSSVDSLDTISLCMVFDVSVQFLEISQKAAYNMLLLEEFLISRCSTSSLTIQLENI